MSTSTSQSAQRSSLTPPAWSSRTFVATTSTSGMSRWGGGRSTAALFRGMGGTFRRPERGHPHHGVPGRGDSWPLFTPGLSSGDGNSSHRATWWSAISIGFGVTRRLHLQLIAGELSQLVPDREGLRWTRPDPSQTSGMAVNAMASCLWVVATRQAVLERLLWVVFYDLP